MTAARRFTALFSTLLLASCSQGPTAPSASMARGKTDAERAPVSDVRLNPGGAQGIDVKAGPITIQRIRVSIDGSPRFYAQSDGAYTVPAGSDIALWVEWISDTPLGDAPRLIVQWGNEGADNIHCGPCLLTHRFKEGLHPITVRMDDRVGGVTTRTFVLDTRPVETVTGYGTFAGELTTSDPTFDRYDDSDFAPPTAAGCALEGDSFYYDTYVVVHPGGPLTIELNTGTLTDTYLNVFSGSFNPGNACQNIVASNDDGGPGLSSLVTGNFPAGTYIVVATSYSDLDVGTYTLIIR